uniref:Heat shock 70 kDa protein 12B n=1 Tax=Anas zonorhyncha TaxID=75864 RepID=A0A8B9UM80_9AVES
MPGGLAARSSPEHPPGWGSWGVLRFLRNFGEGCGVPWGAMGCRAVPCGAAPCRRGSAPPAAVCRKWEGGDPGVANQKTPTSLLLTPEGGFHSFGYTARDYYHDLDPEEARDWLYFEKFKMKIHSTSDLTMKTELEAVNGQKMPALEVFAHALRFFKQHAVQELQEQCPALPEQGAVRWVITVPAIWKQPAKQFMREAAYK